MAAPELRLITTRRLITSDRRLGTKEPRLGPQCVCTPIVLLLLVTVVLFETFLSSTDVQTEVQMKHPVQLH